MPKAKSDEDDDLAKQECKSEDVSEAKTDKKSRRADDHDDHDDSDADSDSANELTPVKTKIGESKDNLRQRSNYFQKRRQ